MQWLETPVGVWVVVVVVLLLWWGAGLPYPHIFRRQA